MAKSILNYPKVIKIPNGEIRRLGVYETSPDKTMRLSVIGKYVKTSKGEAGTTFIHVEQLQKIYEHRLKPSVYVPESVLKNKNKFKYVGDDYVTIEEYGFNDYDKAMHHLNRLWNLWLKKLK